MHVLEPLLAHLRGITTKSTPDPFAYPEDDNENYCFFKHLEIMLGQATYLERLCIKPFQGCSEDINLPRFSISCPSLKEYEGPRRLFERLTIGDELCSLTLRPLESFEHSSPEDILRDLRRIPSSIDKLAVHVTEVPEGFLAAIASEFKDVKELSISAAQIDEDRVCS